MLKKLHDKFKLTYTRIIALGFFTIILVGAFLLCLPLSSRSGTWTPFFDALFTAVSSTCVTGLVVYDTYVHWSVFGQTVILIMIQIGGLGLMTMITMLSIFLKRRISLHERILLVQSAGTMRLSGVVRLIKRIIKLTFAFELVGAAVLATRFCRDMGALRGIYNAIFHSVSAFCNAGFDLLGRFGQFSSFTARDYESDVVVNLTIMCLIIFGGLGFLVWEDVIDYKFNIKKYSLHSKLVLSATAVLIFGGASMFMIFERNASMESMSVGGRVLASLFQSVTTRTAGFGTIDMAELSESGSILSIVLMFIGGSPGSTAGGIKTTTIVVLMLSAISPAKHMEGIVLFKRRLSEGILRQANALFVIYMSAVIVSTMIICAVEPYSVREILFETVSAVGTVGLSMGLTPQFGHLSHAILMLLMFSGRIGGFSMMLVFAEKKEEPHLKRPEGKILIG